MARFLFRLRRFSAESTLPSKTCTCTVVTSAGPTAGVTVSVMVRTPADVYVWFALMYERSVNGNGPTDDASPKSIVYVLPAFGSVVMPHTTSLAPMR